MQTWIDLPEHPHLAACRFFRTVNDQVAIFAEYVDGGSLADAIEGRRFTSLDQVLDVAIQFAWGLHAAHMLGLVHQDVKPGNVLMTDQGLAKVSDFGLARARVTADERAGDAAGRSALVSWGGMTGAYCSPEQSKIYELMRAGVPRQDWPKLTRQTDIWSWGVSVLEMFTGEVTWSSGQVAPEALKDYLATGPASSRSPAMPPTLGFVLRKCFRRDPAERWETMAKIAGHLKRAYREALNRDYPRQGPALPEPKGGIVAAPDRQTRGGLQWEDPRALLFQAFAVEGRDPTEIESHLPQRMGSRKAQAIADMATYEEIRLIFERLVSGGRKNLETVLATLCIEKALVHLYVDDGPGAVALYDRAIAIRERLVEQEGRRELASKLARAVMNKAAAVSALGDDHTAVALYDRAIDVYQRLVEQEGRRDLRGDVAGAVVLRASSLVALGETARARADVRGALASLEAEVARTGRGDLKNVLDWANARFSGLM